MEDPEFRDQPTPPPLTRDTAGVEQASFTDRVLAGWKPLVALIAVGLVIVVASVVLLLGRAGTTMPKFENPPSLEELAQQYPELASLLNDPTLGSVYKEFLLAYETGGMEAAEELAAQRGMLNDRSEIRITLVLDSAEFVPALSAELQGVGITVEGSYKERVNVGVPLALIQQLAGQQSTQALFEQLTQMEHIIRLELPAPNRVDVVMASGVDGQGVAVTGANKWHAAGITGESIRVGVLDLGFDGYRDLLGTELPDNVVAASFTYGVEPDQSGEVHGAACAEIVHEMAPGASLFFAYYDSSMVSMGQAVDWLLSQGVHIITNSTSGVVGPMDGSDESAAMVDDAVSRGVLWVNSSGNAAEEHYRGLFADNDGDGLHEFSNGAEAMGIYVYDPNLLIALNWDDWRYLTEDYDLYLYDEQGDLLASSEDMQSGAAGQAAAEVIVGSDVAEGMYYVTVKGSHVARSGTLDLYVLGAEIEFPVSDHSLGSPADARGSLTVGATQYQDDTLASYSSQGPSNDGRLKPEISAPAGVFSASYKPDVFHGTSASTPHVAGAAALVWSAFPDFTAAQVRDYLQTNALDLGPTGPDNGYGYGRLRLPAPPTESGSVPVIPTLVPTPLPFATTVPEATKVAVIPGSGEDPTDTGRITGGGGSLALLAGLGLCGGLVVLGGGGLLVVAVARTSRRSSQRASGRPVVSEIPWDAVPERWVPDAYPSHESGPAQSFVLVGAGLRPVDLRLGVTTIGRSSDNDIVLDSLQVSRRHARVQCAGGRCTMEDLGSANGLFVNGQRVSGAVLSPGDRLRFGDVELSFQAEATAQSQSWLEIAGNRHLLSQQGTTIGRSHENDVHLTDAGASRRHARIDVQQGVCVISDLGSANGTFVNGNRIQQQQLRDGDEIRIGDSRFRFHQ